jgi:hypothetical protein
MSQMRHGSRYLRLPDESLKFHCSPCDAARRIFAQMMGSWAVSRMKMMQSVKRALACVPAGKGPSSHDTGMSAVLAADIVGRPADILADIERQAGEFACGPTGGVFAPKPGGSLLCLAQLGFEPHKGTVR